MFARLGPRRRSSFLPLSHLSHLHFPASKKPKLTPKVPLRMLPPPQNLKPRAPMPLPRRRRPLPRISELQRRLRRRHAERAHLDDLEPAHVGAAQGWRVGHFRHGRFVSGCFSRVLVQGAGWNGTVDCAAGRALRVYCGWSFTSS